MLVLRYAVAAVILLLIFGVPLALVLRAMAKQTRAGNIALFPDRRPPIQRLTNFALAPLGVLPLAIWYKQWLFAAMILGLSGAFLFIAKRDLPNP